MTITDNEKLTVLKLLAGGRDVEFAAAAVGLDVDTVTRAVSAHGYPDTSKLAWAADVLERNMADARRDAAVTRPTVPRPGPGPATPAPARAAQLSPVADTISNLIARGKKSEQPAKVRRAAERAETAIAALRETLREHEAAKRAAAAAAAEKERARVEAAAERERLTAEVATLQQRIRELGGPASNANASPATRAGVAPSEIRTWATANGIPVRPSGKIAGAIVDQYLTANPPSGA